MIKKVCLVSYTELLRHMSTLFHDVVSARPPGRLAAYLPACMSVCRPSVGPSLCLPVCLPVCLSANCLSVCLTVCLSVSLCRPVCLSVCLLTCLSVCLRLPPWIEFSHFELIRRFFAWLLRYLIVQVVILYAEQNILFSLKETNDQYNTQGLT